MNTPHTAHSTLHTAHSLPSAHSLLSALSPPAVRPRPPPLLLRRHAGRRPHTRPPRHPPTGSGPALTFQLPDRPAYGVPTTRATVPGAPPHPRAPGRKATSSSSSSPSPLRRRRHRQRRRHRHLPHLHHPDLPHQLLDPDRRRRLVSYTPAGATAPGPILPSPGSPCSSPPMTAPSASTFPLK